LKIDKEGVVREFPDLEDNKNWREEGLKRLKNHLTTLSNDDKRAEYVIEELSNFGYEAFKKQKQGGRVENL